MHGFRRMFVLVLLFLTLCCAGCAYLGLGGDDYSVDETLVLDGNQDFTAEIDTGETLLLDIRNPGSGGYKIKGASFDPNILRMEHFSTTEPGSGMTGDFGRIHYIFKALKPGETKIEIKIHRPWEKKVPPEVYKRVTVRIS